MERQNNLTGRQTFTLFIIIWGIVNLIQAFFTPLHNDEAYYWMFSQYPAWGYYDHPPAIAMLIGAGYLLFSNELGVRLFVVFCHIATLLIIWNVMGKNIKESAAHVFVFIMAITVLPIINIYAFLATPDPPLLLFTALFLFFYRRFLKDEKWPDTVMLGISMAGLMYSKYHGAILLLLIIISNLKLLKNYKFYIASVFAVLLFLPHILWQIRNGFPSFQYHLADRLSGFDISNFLEYIPNQLLVHNPLLLPLFLIVIFKTKSKDLFERGLKYIIAGFLIFFLISGFRYHVEPQWTALVVIPMIILVFNNDRIYGSRKFIRITFFTIVPVIMFARVALMIDFLPVSFLKREFHDHEKRMKEIEKLADERPLVFTNSYQDPSVYSFYTGKFAHSLDNKDYRKTQYDIWPFEEEVNGSEILYVPHWLSDYYRERLNHHIMPSGDTIYYRIFRDFQSLQKKCAVPYHDSWSFSNTVEETIDLRIFNPYPHTLRFSHPEFTVRIQVALYRGDGYIEAKRNINITPMIGDLYPGDTISVSGSFGLNGIPEGSYKMVICTETGILYDTFSSEFYPVTIRP